MKADQFINIIGSDFFTGVPDSQLKPLCNFLIDKYGIDEKHHLIAANEGNATALAAGYYLATSKIPVVYMQNSGEGNIINPVASLLNDEIYGIPCIFIIGWRGEPSIHDEPQHIFQGEVTCKLLEVMDIKYHVIDRLTDADEIKATMDYFKNLLNRGKQVAFVVRKGALEYDKTVIYSNENNMLREEIIAHIVAVSKNDPIISTTGKISRELFEIREKLGQNHSHDFLTVGSMGHSSSIALGISSQIPEKKVWIIDGDGAALMHMGSMAVIGASSPNNLVHIVINNSAHESVGGMPTVAGKINFVSIAKGCGYKNAVCVSTYDELDDILAKAKYQNELSFIEVKSALGSRDNLGRPTTTPKDNKVVFMQTLQS
ncbi:MAG: phosphonopyruvate decarboxylase [Eubacteriales bacterium]|nr:phosphonopyruvate decarboxylase [Eubacteriales bacterium]